MGSDGNVGKFFTNVGKSQCGKICENCGEIVGKLWENCGKIVGKKEANVGKYVGKSGSRFRETCGEIERVWHLGSKAAKP